MSRRSDDVAVIIRSFKENGMEISPKQATELWSQFSKEMFAGWLKLPNRECIYPVLKDSFRGKVYNDNPFFQNALQKAYEAGKQDAANRKVSKDPVTPLMKEIFE